MKRSWHNRSYEAWPAIDQAVWRAVLRDGDILDDRGTGAHWADATRLTIRKHYGCWLGWLDTHGLLIQSETPVERIKQERIEAYARDLMDCVASKTVSSYLRDLTVMARAMSPDENWQWLMEISSRLKRWAKPSRPMVYA